MAVFLGAAAVLFGARSSTNEMPCGEIIFKILDPVAQNLLSTGLIVRFTTISSLFFANYMNIFHTT